LPPLETELAVLVADHSPQLLAAPWCGPICAAILIGHTNNPQRFPTEAKYARHTGTAPVPASSGATHRHSLDRGGDRQLNHAIHIIALSRADPP
jgi:transposase